MSLLDTIDLLDRLVAYPSVSSASNLEISAALAQRLEDIGAHVELLHSACGQKANLFARLGPEAPGGLLLSGHTDVVPTEGQVWQSDPFTLRREGDRLYGRGTCDMKGFVAAAVTCAPHHQPDRPIYFSFTHDEEVGCLGARALIPELKARGIKPDMALIGEPTGMQVIDGHKGCAEYTTRFFGKAGHGSNPGAGVNAVEYAVRYAGRLMALRGELMARAGPDSRFDPAWSTVNVGRIAGGVAHNVIPDYAEVFWEMRPVTAADAAHVHAQLRALTDEIQALIQAIHPEAWIDTREIGDVTGLTPMADNTLRDLLLDMLDQPSAGTVPFNTEAGLFQSLGADTVVCGPGHIAQAHTANEYIEISQLSACVDLLDRLMTQA
ncbi:MAG: acetylornithine deacetylase [Pseudomonadota bacterium]